jgi:4-hydroxy-tetrahydrodipicolinate synthase
MESPFGPLITAMATPFTPDGVVHYERAEELAQRLVENGSTGLVVSGTTGEGPTLTPEEKLQLFRRVKSAVNVPVIANTGDNETAFSTEFSRQAQETGVDGLLLVVPYYNRPNQEGLYQHFKVIAESVQLPCVLYNVPTRTARNLEAKTVARLSQVKNIIGVKEASGDLAQVGNIRNLCGSDFFLWSGNDGDVLPFVAIGGHGVISVMSHVAGKNIRRMMDAHWKGDWQTARDEHLNLLPVAEALFPATSPSPAPIKAALKLQGFDAGGLRLPLTEAGESDVETLRQAMNSAGLL